MEKSILDIDRLKTNFYTYEGVVKAIDEISFSLESGDTLGIVGETGCGKSVTVLSILQLVLPPGKIEGGRIVYKPGGKPVNLLEQTEPFMRTVRGNEISMIFQEASSALNPVLTINKQVSESFLLHRQKELCESVLEGLSDRLAGKRGFSKLFLRCLNYRYRKKLNKARNNTIG